MARRNPRISIIRFIFTFTLPSQAFPLIDLLGSMLVAYPCHPYIHIYIYIYVVYSCLFHSLYSLYHWLSKPLFWPRSPDFFHLINPRLSSHPHLPVSTSGLRAFHFVSSKRQPHPSHHPSAIHQPSSHPSAISATEAFPQRFSPRPTASARRPWRCCPPRRRCPSWVTSRGGLGMDSGGGWWVSWRNHGKTIGNMGKIPCKWRFLAGKYHRTMACGQVWWPEGKLCDF